MIKGFVGTSLVDYPGKISAVVFYGGCNFRCPYCQNVALVDPQISEDLPEITEMEIVQRIKNRIKMIDGVVISGGEPTLYPDSLERLIGEMKTIPLCKDIPIKLDTNGSNPQVLKTLIDKRLVNYIAMDLKTSEMLYDSITGLNDSFHHINQTIELLKITGIDYEFRITVVPSLVNEEILLALGEKINGCKRFILQQFRPNVTLDPSFEIIEPFSNLEIHTMSDTLRKHFNFEVIERI